MAEYLRESSGAKLAAAIYAGSFLAMAVAFFAMQRNLLFGQEDLLGEDFDEHHRAAINRRNRAGLVPYAVAALAALISPYVTLAICAALAVFYARPLESAAS